MKPLERILLYALVVLGTAAIAGWAVSESVSAQLNIFGSPSSSSSPTPTPSPSATPTPTPIPLAGVVPESESVTRRINQIKRKTLSDPTIRDTRRTFEARLRTFDEASSVARAELAGIPSLKTISDIESTWKFRASTIASLQTDLKEFSTQLDEAEQDLAEMYRKWVELRETVRTADRGAPPPAPKPEQAAEEGSDPAKEGSEQAAATPTPAPPPVLLLTAGEIPPAIRLKIDQTIAEIDRARASLGEMRTDLLSLQADISRHEEQIDEIISLAEMERQSALSNLLSRDVPPIWASDARGGDKSQGLQGGFTEMLEEAHEHLLLILVGTPFMVIVSLVPLLLLLRAKRKARSILEEEPELEKRLVFFTSPYTSWILLTVWWLFVSFSGKSELAEVVLGLALLLPGYYLLKKVAAESLLQIVNVLVVFYVFDVVLPLFEGFPFFYRILFAVEMAAGIALVLWLRRRDPKVGIFDKHEKFFVFLRKLAFLSVVPFVIALVSDVLGYLSLARLISKGVLASAYLAVFHYVIYLVLISLIVLLMRSWPLSRLEMMRDHRPLVLRKVSVLLAVLLAFSWLIEMFDQFFLSESVSDIVNTVLGYALTLGSFSIRVADVLIFLFVVWLAFTLSRLIRFVLEEDVYSRVALKDGVGYAASTIVHYVILFGGFSLAILSLGVDLTKFTILAGAFGVGLGFGLQNIVENFVSGLILLFERPVTVGDVIQRGQQTGDLKRIGLRASVMGTPEGAEVIVPNGVLLSEEVTNWTPASHLRRLDIDVGVAYGNDPEKVMELLVGCATSHPEVKQDPEPVSLFAGFGDSALNFQLRAWADSESRWWKIRSDIAVAVYKALNEAGIEIPFPQADLNLKSAVPESVIRLISEKHKDRSEEKE